MSFIKRHLDYMVIMVLIIVFSFIPITLRVIRTFSYMSNFGSDTLGFVEYWQYSLTQTFNVYLMLLSPFFIFIFGIVSFHKSIRRENLICEEYDFIKVNRIKQLVKKAWGKSLLFLMVPSILALLAATIAPTSVSNTGYLAGTNSFIYFLSMNVNMILFSLLMANIGVIACRFFERFIFVILSSIFVFCFLTFGLIAAGGALESVISGNYYSDWLFIYSPIFIESNSNYLFEFIFIFTLFIMSFVVMYYGYKGNKDITD